LSPDAGQLLQQIDLVPRISDFQSSLHTGDTGTHNENIGLTWTCLYPGLTLHNTTS